MRARTYSISLMFVRNSIFNRLIFQYAALCLSIGCKLLDGVCLHLDEIITHTMLCLIYLIRIRKYTLRVHSGDRDT